jgi:Flp pilus assembly pilin Flp
VTIRDESGQTTVEYLMIAGLIMSMMVMLLDVVGIDNDAQKILQDLTQFIIGQVTDPPY